MNKVLNIGTHNGMFHCDEVLACFLLKLLPKYKNAKIVRTRDTDILKKCDIVVDVGNQYDPQKNMYDHHMRHFNETISTVIKKPGYDCTIKLSSAGLIYCHFGYEILKQILPTDISDNDIESIFKSVYNLLIKEIDAVDNGIPMFNEEPVYRIETGISSRVNRLNPNWNDIGMDIEQQFKKAMDLVGEEFMYFVQYVKDVQLPAKSVVKRAIAKRFDVDQSGEIIILERCVPWKQHIYDIEKEQNIESAIKFVIFKDNEYRVCGVPLTLGSFVCRIFLPENWAGLRNEELEQASGIKGSIFVHATRYIGGHKTEEGILAMARKTLKIKNLHNDST